MSSSNPLIALKTKLEVRARDDVVHVYVVKVAVRLANETLKLLKSITEPAAIDLQHLRRFARPGELPYHLRSTLSGSCDVTTQSDSGPTLPDLYLLVGPVTSTNVFELEDILSEALPEQTAHECSTIHTIAVPLLAPTSPEQAKSWSSSYWPTVYKKSNPFGPHPSIISRAEGEVIRDLDTWMGMAARAAIGSKSMGYGEAIGAVIVERGRQNSHAVALAGDGRWKGYEQDGIGNPMAHAVLRAIGMVAQNLKAVEEEKDYSEYLPGRPEQEQDVFLDGPIIPEEKAIYESGRVPSSGYLCHGLEIYITHEPCVACSMALLHSRFIRVVFGQRMPRTGGLCSEIYTFRQEGRRCRSLGHGLFWRKELNWSFLAWQTEVKDADLDIDSVVHA